MVMATLLRIGTRLSRGLARRYIFCMTNFRMKKASQAIPVAIEAGSPVRASGGLKAFIQQRYCRRR